MVSNDPKFGPRASDPTPLSSEPPPPEDITGLLVDWQAGDTSAQERLLPLVYSELHRLARLYLSGENVGHTLQATALVNEAYLKLIDQTRVSWQNRAQFFGVAARMMRRILVDHARERRAAKRGGGAWKLSLDDVGEIEGRREMDLVDLDAALIDLSAFDPQQSRLVELRFFAGLTIRETAEALGISPATVKREWNMAKAWLFRRMTQGG
ncbi:MAG: sigma-70 family RNA polymerase sigma factor [Acidobacteriota bacterium]